MNNSIKKVLSLTLSLSLLTCLTTKTHANVEPQSSANNNCSSTEIVEGTCGPCATYKFNPNTGELIISGTGCIHSKFDNIKNSIKSVIIEKGITKIYPYAFKNCTSLTSINIPNSVTTINPYTFENCTSLTSINIPNSVTQIEASTFENCTSLTSINIPNSVTKIYPCAFKNCTSLTSINIPNSVTTIYPYTFENCTSLTSINIPNSVTQIELFAFRGCTSLTSVKIQSPYTNINCLSFPGGVEITRNTETKGSCGTNAKWKLDFSTGKLCIDGTGAITFAGFKDYKDFIKSVEIQKGISLIHPNVFNGCGLLTSVKAPRSTFIIDSTFNKSVEIIRY